jgi:hypothetical protein
MAPRPEVTIYVSSQSSRNGAKPELIVLHTTEGHDRPGVSDLEGLGNYFDGVDASSHVANDRDGNDARYVADERKSWTQAYYNPVSLSIEQIGFARFTRDVWLKDRAAQLRNTAEWIAYWSLQHDIPIQRGAVNDGRVVRKGVVTHEELGAKGGGHHDPGDGYPMDVVLAMAEQIAKANPEMGRKERRWRKELRKLRSKAARRKRRHERPSWLKEDRVRGRRLKALIKREARKRRES